MDRNAIQKQILFYYIGELNRGLNTLNTSITNQSKRFKIVSLEESLVSGYHNAPIRQH
jgi:hypothetical protein